MSDSEPRPDSGKVPGSEPSLPNPVAQREFATLEDFVPSLRPGGNVGSNNFFLHFGSTENGHVADYKSGTPAYSRFAKLYPERVEELDQLIGAQNLRELTDENYNPDIWERLYSAYQLMSGLVDASDPRASRELENYDEMTGELLESIEVPNTNLLTE